MSLDHTHSAAAGHSSRPFRAAVWRGLGRLLPPLLTVVVIFTLLGTVRHYVLLPVESGVNWVVAQWIARSIVPDERTHEGTREPRPTLRIIDEQRYQRASDGRYVPEHIFATVQLHDGYATAKSCTSWQLCERYAEQV